MKIAVLVKEVPDTYGERTLNLETGLAERGASENVTDEIGERALEVALSYAEANEGTEVSVLTVAPEGATASIRKCLAMGAASATHVVDEGLTGADLGLTAEVIAAALKRVGFDLIIAGNQSTDGMGGVLPAMIAELLDVPNATNLSELTITADGISGVRASDDATVQVTAQLPAVVSVTEALPDARFPNFKGIMAAKKKPLEVLSLSDLGIDAEDMSASRAIMLGITERPPREAGVKITDEGDAAAKLTAFLVENHLV
ncbi:electron transfer flavoprotein subunit beta/FixA family protein [Leucobacter coleopterorum]|uniref:Electron transfer flavoprotein subunit beta n=1 Tax=Leucobacter coleopterorum TaxID=2714933 RepID=A0ABX6JY36_9MICO|nr:electron transfer flavoprotein subunit beta/FixA family protein [Leucobacter coleopterorum]QIM19242.1 electron transfer flavoprotein subunit beta/FixA family protein [Leucobacter coleopterorum]